MRVAVLGAGGPAGVNALRALRAAGHDCIATDSDERHLVWCNQLAETVPMPEVTPEAIDALGANVVIPQADPLVALVGRYNLRARTFLPWRDVIARCQDKLETARIWHEAGLRELPPQVIESPWPDHLHLARDRFGLPFWLRATRGAGAKGAILVSEIEQGYHWLRFWETRGSEMEWVAEEYLPGRDLAWSSVWYDGELQSSFARERLEYLYPHLTPEGLTGTPTIARIVHDNRVNETAYAAVLAVDTKPHGIYSVDLREDDAGIPRPTEINAGRGFTTFGLWSLTSGPNFLDLAVRLAVDGPSWWLYRPDIAQPEKWDALPEGLTLYRHIDCRFTFTRRPISVLAA